jgi:fibro-slime domain-containing protein
MKSCGLAVIATLCVLAAGCARGTSNSQATSPPESASVLPTASSPAPETTQSPSEAPAGGATPEGSPTAAASEAVGTAPSPGCSPGAGQIEATYFTLPENHPDVGHGVDGSIVTGLVAKTLGPDGFPVVTQTGRTGSQASGPIHDVNGAGEILWWSAASPHGVKLEKTVSECLPIDNHSMFADGSTDGDSTLFLTAHYQGVFDTPAATTIGMNEGSDDDSWIFIDGVLVVDNGGVKPRADAPFSVAHLSPGRHTLDVFYADRHGSAAELGFQPQFPVSPPPPATSAPPSATPAPATPSATPPPATAPAATASPAPTAKAEPAAIAKQLETQKRIRIYGIHFDVDKATIQPQSENVIAQIAKVMRDNPTWRFRVEGHTDSDGGYQHNVVLSQNRAQAVVNDLVNRYHIARARLQAVGYSYSRPVAPNTTAANKALNRRVELVLL